MLVTTEDLRELSFFWISNRMIPSSLWNHIASTPDIIPLPRNWSTIWVNIFFLNFMSFHCIFWMPCSSSRCKWFQCTIWPTLCYNLPPLSRLYLSCTVLTILKTWNKIPSLPVLILVQGYNNRVVSFFS